ncbi:hypothetical protein B0O99DRAFT_609287 [Bisporella sp. PMI_857]|nr:hypothetical protein B0O99DRAFT_609287 [Bisporella sp. PMI_857]
MDEHLCCEGFKIGNVSSSKEIQHKKLAFWPHRSGHQFGDEEVLASSFKGDIKRLVREPGADYPRKEYNPLTDEAEIEEEIRPRTQPGLWQDKYEHNRREAFEYFMHGGMAFDLLTGRNLSRVFNQAMLVDETLESVFETLADKEEIAIIHGHSVSASESVEKGDIICILLGCQYPVILRPNKEGYSVVGECYIDDAMQGEAMAWLDSGDCQVEEFTLY